MIKIIIIATDHLNLHIVPRKIHYNPYLRFSDRHHRHHSNQTHPVLFLWRPLRLRITSYQIWSTWSSCVFLLKMEFFYPDQLELSHLARLLYNSQKSFTRAWQRPVRLRKDFEIQHVQDQDQVKDQDQDQDQEQEQGWSEWQQLGPHLNIGQIRSPSLSCVPTVRPRCSLQ